MSESYREAKAVPDNVKSSAWSYFKCRVSGEEIVKSFVHCKLCLDAGQKKKAQIKFCGGTTNLTNHLKTWHKADPDPRFIAFLRLARPEYDPPSRITLAMYIKLLNKRRLSLSEESVLMQMLLKDNLEL